MFTDSKNLLPVKNEAFEYKIFDCIRCIQLCLYKKHSRAKHILNVLKTKPHFRKLGIYSFKQDEFTKHDITDYFVNAYDELSLVATIDERTKNAIYNSKGMRFDIFINYDNYDDEKCIKTVLDFVLYI